MDSPREWPSLSSLIQGMGVSILCPHAPAALSLTASPQLPRAEGESPKGPGTSASLWRHSGSATGVRGRGWVIMGRSFQNREL